MRPSYQSSKSSTYYKPHMQMGFLTVCKLAYVSMRCSDLLQILSFKTITMHAEDSTTVYAIGYF